MSTHTESSSPNQAEEFRRLENHVQRLNQLAIIGGTVALIVVGFYLLWFASAPSDDPQHWGQFGDYVGGLLNPTFSFLALLALLATLGLQMRELRHSVQELANSADALAKQNETLRLQTFEGTFFQTLRLHNDIVAAMEIPHRSLKGRSCFDHYASELHGTLINQGATKSVKNAGVLYDNFYRQNQSALGHYFRLLYNLVKFVDSASDVDKRFYTNLVRAQLSSAELLLLFYNCLSTLGQDKFKPLVEKYALLKTIPDDYSLPEEELLREYEVSAFGGTYPEPWM
jgi:hypothetical protein